MISLTVVDRHCVIENVIENLMPIEYVADVRLPERDYAKRHSYCIQDYPNPHQIRQDCVTEFLVIGIVLIS